MNADRWGHLQYLAHSGIPVVHSGGLVGEFYQPLDTYASIYQQSKITLNFCLSCEARSQTKGRLFEAMMCGACVFEQDNAETRRWFEPWVDYVPFSSPEELPDLVRQYLADDELRMRVAASGKRKVENQYTAKKWWESVLRHCGVWKS